MTMQKPRGSRLEQLQRLHERSVFDRASAAAVAFDYELAAGVLSRMADEGLVHNEYMPVGGDPRRRCSCYWLAEPGRAALRAFKGIAAPASASSGS